MERGSWWGTGFLAAADAVISIFLPFFFAVPTATPRSTLLLALSSPRTLFFLVLLSLYSFFFTSTCVFSPSPSLFFPPVSSSLLYGRARCRHVTVTVQRLNERSDSPSAPQRAILSPSGCECHTNWPPAVVRESTSLLGITPAVLFYSNGNTARNKHRVQCVGWAGTA